MVVKNFRQRKISTLTRIGWDRLLLVARMYSVRGHPYGSLLERCARMRSLYAKGFKREITCLEKGLEGRWIGIVQTSEGLF